MIDYGEDDMSPIARAELRGYKRRVRKASRARDRQFAQPSPLMELAARYWWIAVFIWIAFVWWWAL